MYPVDIFIRLPERSKLIVTYLFGILIRFTNIYEKVLGFLRPKTDFRGFELPSS